jgi:hypothetical protein
MRTLLTIQQPETEGRVTMVTILSGSNLDMDTT